MTTMITGNLYTVVHAFIYDSAKELEKDLSDYETQSWQNESNYISNEIIVVFLRICTFKMPFDPWKQSEIYRRQGPQAKKYKMLKYAKVILGDKIKYVKLDCLKKYNKK